MGMITEPLAVPTIIGTPFDGGFYAGRYRIGDDLFALIVSPAAAAWAQLFNHGFQLSYRKATEFRARAVRRLPL
jgi:hypothetical protein